jgi:hypothetical protein
MVALVNNLRRQTTLMGGGKKKIRPEMSTPQVKESIGNRAVLGHLVLKLPEGVFCFVFLRAS